LGVAGVYFSLYLFRYALLEQNPIKHNKRDPPMLLTRIIISLLFLDLSYGMASSFI